MTTVAAVSVIGLPAIETGPVIAKTPLPRSRLVRVLSVTGPLSETALAPGEVICTVPPTVWLPRNAVVLRPKIVVEHSVLVTVTDGEKVKVSAAVPLTTWMLHVFDIGIVVVPVASPVIVQLVEAPPIVTLSAVLDS